MRYEEPIMELTEWFEDIVCLSGETTGDDKGGDWEI